MIPQNPSPSVPDPARVDEFMRLFTQHQRHVYYFIRTLCPNPSDAEEVLSRTNLLLWEKFSQFESGTNFRAWACRIARFEVFNYRAEHRREVLFSEEMLLNLADDLERDAEYIDAVTRAIKFCREKLTKTDRETLDLRYQPGGTSAKTAQALHRPVRSVYKSLTRIRKSLYECVMRRLRREGIE